METRVIQVRSDEEAAEAAALGAHALKEGKLVGFATETVYGIAAMATGVETMDRLRELKSRPERPFSVHLGRPEDVSCYVRDVPPPARRLIEKAWPGPITLLLPTDGALADERLQAAGMHDVLCMDNHIGLRCPQGVVCQKMLSAVEDPVVVPSANLPGENPPRNAEEVLERLAGRIDLLIDSGPCRYGKNSTIVRCNGDGWEVVRKGIFDSRTIRRLLQRTILFVCTGNTCRSPVAAGLAGKLLAERLGAAASELDKKGVSIVSAGLWAVNGHRATPEAIQAARKLGVDIANHRSQELTVELINSADLIFCMTDFHVAAVCRLVPSAAGRVRRLDRKADISDPIGGGADVYRRTAERIKGAIEQALDKEVL